jgi:hypothetical protein
MRGTSMKLNDQADVGANPDSSASPCVRPIEYLLALFIDLNIPKKYKKSFISKGNM